MLKYPVSLLIFLSVAPNAFSEFIPKKIATVDHGTCVVSTEGIVKCWGLFNETYGTSFGPPGESNWIVNLGTNLRITDICGAANHACAVTDDGRVKCWGLNSNGELGQGNTNQPMMGDDLPFTNLGLTFRAHSISCGEFQACAMSHEGRVKCWGLNILGSFGLGDSVSRGQYPEDMGEALPYLPVATRVYELSSGGDSNCAASSEGLRCWGYNYAGELGQGDRITRGDRPQTAGDRVPTILLESRGVGINIVKIASTSESSHCAIYTIGDRRGNHIKCWGLNSSGQLGLGDDVWRGATPNSMGASLPELDLGMGEIVDVEGHFDSFCALSAKGQVKCWGNPTRGGLGLGDNRIYGNLPSNSGRNLPFVDLGLPAISISSGTNSQHYCAILENRRLKCWGWGVNGQLGYPNTEVLGDGPNEMGVNLPFVNLE